MFYLSGGKYISTIVRNRLFVYLFIFIWEVSAVCLPICQELAVCLFARSQPFVYLSAVCLPVRSQLFVYLSGVSCLFIC